MARMTNQRHKQGQHDRLGDLVFKVGHGAGSEHFADK
jgi:hypothetical protein